MQGVALDFARFCNSSPVKSIILGSSSSFFLRVLKGGFSSFQGACNAAKPEIYCSNKTDRSKNSGVGITIHFSKFFSEARNLTFSAKKLTDSFQPVDTSSKVSS